jgi:SAM-dependent methyltransferase
MHAALASIAALALISPDALVASEAFLGRAYGSMTYTERLMVGRKAQLGEDMILRRSIGDTPTDDSKTYGEYNLRFFAELVDHAIEALAPDRTATFVDVGSGVGRLTLAASQLWPNRFARFAGVECVPELHALALEAEAKAAIERRDDGVAHPRCDFVLGDAVEALAGGGPLADADLCFAYSSAFPGQGDLLGDFSRVCGACLRVGTCVITTDRRLHSVDGLWSFELIERLEGVNAETGGEGAVGYVQRVTRSLRDE